MSAEAAPAEPALTAPERRLCLAHCLIKLGWTAGFGLSSAARMAHVLELCGHDMLQLSQFNSTAWGLNRMCAAVLGPIVASLSDAYGRVPFLLAGRIGLACWFAGVALSKNMWHYAITEQLTWGFMMCGWEAVEDAFFADLFGERPELSGRIRSRNGFWAGIAGFVAPFVGIWCAARSRLGTIWLGAVSCLLQCAVILWHGDTLPVAKRRPFKLAMANPFSSLTLLFRNGPGLRRLGYCATCFTGCASSWGTQVILSPAPGVSNEGRSSELLVLVPAVSWPWVPAWGSLEPPRPGGENAQKTRKNGGKMGEIQPKRCEGRELTKDQLAGLLARQPGRGQERHHAPRQHRRRQRDVRVRRREGPRLCAGSGVAAQLGGRDRHGAGGRQADGHAQPADAHVGGHAHAALREALHGGAQPPQPRASERQLRLADGLAQELYRGW